jgi:DNA-binding response OmpR family regulator
MTQVRTEKAVRTMARPARVLIVEDNREAADTLLTLLSGEGYEVRAVYSGCEALAAMDEFDADAVLIDLRLLDLNGWEVARRIRKARGADRPRLIAMSGEYTADSTSMLGQLARFERFLAKPFQLDDVLAALAPSTTRRS